MGMFDTIRFLDPTTQIDVPRCKGGHLIDDLQTKDFDPDEMTQYIVWKGHLYKIEERQSAAESAPVLVDQHCIVTTTQEIRYRRLQHTGSVDAYSFCHECLPVLFMGAGGGFFGDQVSELEPWCEYDLRFRGGELMEILPIRVETRADVAAKNATLGRDHIPDTDRIAVRHFERSAEHRAKVRRIRGGR